MVTLLSTAHDALKTSNDVLQKLGVETPKAKAKTMWHRWPIVLGVSTCTIATITAVAMVILGSAFSAVPVALCAIGSGVVSVYIYQKLDFGDLSEYITAFSQKVTALSKTALGLHQANHDLDVVQKQLRDQLKERERVMKKQKDEADASLGQLEKVAKQLAQTRGQLESMKKVFDGSQRVVDLLSKKLREFFTVEGTLNASSVELNKLLEAVRSERKSVRTKLHEMGKDKAVAGQRAKAKKAADEMFSQFEVMLKKFVDVQKENEVRKKELAELGAATSTLGKKTKELSSATSDLGKQVDSARKLVAQLDAASGGKTP